ncbi:MAG: heavy-metal-associated domain-containing protein [Clostridia bacterium]|nr:heavy-metal-associated domain-containing protein [Clostridia bacterium]
MIEITLKIEGMMCGMCESHVNAAVRNAFDVKKVSSSHTDKETIIISEDDIPDEKIKEVIAETGYELKEITRKPYEKKGLFGIFKK